MHFWLADKIKTQNFSDDGTAVRTVRQYAGATTIHGIPYILEEGRLACERVLWVLLVLGSLIFALWFSANIYRTWEDDPVLTSVSTTGFPIQKMEYPSITICAQGAVNEVVGKKVSFWGEITDVLCNILLFIVIFIPIYPTSPWPFYRCCHLLPICKVLGG